jgi:hypothetical protein
MDRSPKTKAATIEWLRIELDKTMVVRMQQHREIESLRAELGRANTEARNWKKKWAAAEAWADVQQLQSDATTKDLQQIYTKWNLEHQS